MKHIMLILGIFSIVLLTITDTDAQRRTRERERDRREDTENISKIYHTIHMGNINFFSGNFSLSAKYAAGYKLHDRFSAGLAGKFFFDIISQPGDDINLFSYGAGAFVRARITNDIYLQGEYDLTNYDEFNTSRDIHGYPLVGAGYEQGQGPWKFGANAMLILNEDVRDLFAVGGRVVEWWITFSYNF